ncbi:MAG: EamA family transporter [Bacteroidia bacterium]|nr:EamA family transporter [Bacteroidia bacterium]
MLEKQNKNKNPRPSCNWKVVMLFVLTFAILLVGQYASKTGALLLNHDKQKTALLFISLGYCCMVFRGLIWIMLVKYVRLSVAYPIQSFSFILITGMGVFVFNETLSLIKILGILLILAGVVSVALSK